MVCLAGKGDAADNFMSKTRFTFQFPSRGVQRRSKSSSCE